MTLSVRLYKTSYGTKKAVVHSEKPYWADSALLDEESKRRLELKDKKAVRHPQGETA